MKYLPLLAAAAVLAFGAPAMAERGQGRFQPAKSRQEAIQRIDQRIGELKQKQEELKKMTDEEWTKKRAENQKMWQERRENRMGARKGVRENAPAAGKPATAAPAPTTKPAQ